MLTNDGNYCSMPHDWFKKVKRGIFMKGLILSDDRGGCACGGKFIRKEELGYTIPACDLCGRYPKKLRIQRYLPTLDGRGKNTFIRYDHRNKRLENIQQAIRVLEFIDYELEEGIFDPKKYASREVADQLKFGHFVKNRYLPMHNNRLIIKEITPGGLRSKKSIAKNHLVPHFGNMDIRDINAAKIQLYFESYTAKLRSRDKSIQELRCILKYAHKLEIISKMPILPSIEKAKSRDVENFPSVDLQNEIIGHIENPIYKAMIRVLALYALRPCEVRAMMWKDLDLNNRVVKIQRHFSGKDTIIDGRKSLQKHEKGGVHYLPMLSEFIEILNGIPRRGPEDFIFKGKRGLAVSHDTILQTWNKACEKANVSGIQLYEGTKHARMSYLKSLGYSDNELMLVTGHSTVEALQRYAQLSKGQHLKVVEKILVQQG